MKIYKIYNFEKIHFYIQQLSLKDCLSQLVRSLTEGPTQELASQNVPKDLIYSLTSIGMRYCVRPRQGDVSFPSC